MHLLYVSAISSLDESHLREVKTYRHTHTQNLYADAYRSFIRDCSMLRNWWVQWPTTWWWKEINLIHSTTWMNLKCTMLSEKPDSKRYMLCGPIMWHHGKGRTIGTEDWWVSGCQDLSLGVGFHHILFGGWERVDCSVFWLLWSFHDYACCQNTPLSTKKSEL